MTKTQETVAKPLRPLSASRGAAKKPEDAITSPGNKKQLNALEQQIALFIQNRKFKVFHFASSHEKEGVSSVVAGLARFMAGKELTKCMLVIDANVHAPALHRVFNTPRHPGFRDVLDDGAMSAIHQLQPGTMDIMPCGKGGVDLSIAARQEKLAALITSLRSEYDCIIIDSPPLLASPDALSLALVSDVTMLVIQAKRTLWEVAQKSKMYLEQNGCLIGGVVLNRVEHVVPSWIYRRV